MKKIVFLQIKGKSLGGVWFVNKTLGEEFKKEGYDVEIVSIRDDHPGIEIKNTVQTKTINKKDKWEIVHRRDVLHSIKKFKFFRTFLKYLRDYIILHNDYTKLKKYLEEINPDYIIASHYQVLNGVPKKYLKKVMYVQHSSFKNLLDDKQNKKTVQKYQNKIYKLVWLSKSTMELAKKNNLNNSTYIYNPCKINTNKIADVTNNKKITVITRISAEKRIDLMIKIVNEIFKDKKFKDWKFEIYGEGEFNNESEKIFKTKQIIYKGKKDNIEEILLSSSINLNTSIYEGFSLSIIEAEMCGVPTISFNFGESAHEQLDNVGFIIENDNVKQFIKQTRNLMEDNKLLKEISLKAKENSKQFKSNIIVKKWIKIFKEMDD